MELIIFPAALLIILGLIHFLIYKTFVFAFAPGHLIFWRWAFVILALSFVGLTLLAFRFYNLLIRITYTLAASWMGFVFYFFIASILFWIIFSLFHPDPKILGSVLFIAAIAVGIYGLINAAIPRVKQVSISIPNLPASWQNKKVVWVSDIHLGDVRNIEFANQIVAKIKQLNPDIVFVGGDYYDGVALDADASAKPFASLKPPMGLYFITGNHEEFTNNRDYTQYVAKNGMTVLDNSHVDVDGVRVIGTDYRDSASAGNLKRILENNVDPSKINILLRHVPNNLQIAHDAGIALQLSGHSHNGQVWPFTYAVQAVFGKYKYGLNYFQGMPIYTSSGVGTWGPPMRVGADPEIVLINLK